jgi:hypothetical protein
MGGFWTPLVVQVKSTAKSPYEHFGPAERQALRQSAKAVRADPYLVWWPPGRKPVWIPEDRWPNNGRL